MTSNTPRSQRAAGDKSLDRWRGADGRELARTAFDLYTAGHATEAIALYGEGYRDALRTRHPVALWWFRNALGAAHNANGEYRKALDDYLAARDTAMKSGWYADAAKTLANLSSLYLHVKDTASALAAGEEAYRLCPNDEPTQRAQILAQLGRALLIRGEGQRAKSVFEEALQLAFMVGDARTEALAWNQMGTEYLRSGDLARAEDALTRAFGVRRLNGDPLLYVTEYQLALLRLRLGDAHFASILIDAVLADPRRDGARIPPHHIYLARARILEAQGRLRESLTDFLRAANAAEEWRGRGLFADRFRIGSDDLMQEIFEGAIDSAARLYRASGDPRYAILSWDLGERIRAASLRETLKAGRSWTGRVPAAYWRMLDRLRALDAARLASGGVTGDSDEAARLRMHLAEMEAQAGAGGPGGDKLPANAGVIPTHLTGSGYTVSPEILVPRISLSHFRTGLGISRTLIAFHLGEKISYRWVISQERFDLKMLPPRRELAEAVKGLRSAIQDGNGAMTANSEKLYATLFGGIQENGTGRRWSIELDEDLFEAPLAALITGRRSGRPVYLIEERAIETIPGAWVLAQPAEAPGKGFVGIGDGIYNTADPRYRELPSARASWTDSMTFVPALLAKSPETIQLPRLIASARELAECARRVEGPVTILTGAEANPARFRAALRGRPNFVHVAAHFLSERGGEQNTAIALGIRRDGAGRPRFEILTADDIAGLRVPGAVVVMSGCSSAAGRVVPAAGLLGLARAWLSAGASAVVATGWPTPDETGELVSKFYERLRGGPSDTLAPAEALRRAQVDMLKSGSARSDPRFWAAYEVFGRSN